MRLRILADDPRPLPGSGVTGRVLVSGSGPVRSLRLWLSFVEATERFSATARVATSVELLHAATVSDHLAVPFTVSLPPDALPTLETPWGDLRWEIAVKLDRPRRRDVHEVLELFVPTAR